MMYILGALSFACFVLYMLWRGAAGARKAYKEAADELSDQNLTLKAEVGRLQHVIQRIEEVNREAAQRQESMATGSDSERFGASLDVLSDIARRKP